MKKIHRYLLLFSLTSSTVFSQNIVQILNYDKEVSFTSLEEIITAISINNKKQLDGINVINYVEDYGNADNANWNKLNTKITYNELKITCFNNICETVQQDIARYRKGGANKLLVCGNLSCTSFNMETSLLPDLSSSTISKKIQDELKINKKTDLTFIIILAPKSNQIPIVKFKTNPVYIKNNIKGKLEPIVDVKQVRYNWTPNQGLSCIDCQYPEVSTKKDMAYTLVVTDKNGCESEPAIVEVVVSDDTDGNENETYESSDQSNCESKSKNFRLISEEQLDELTQEIGEDNIFIEYKSANPPCNPKKHLSLMRNTQSEALFVYDVPFSGELGSCVKYCTWKIFREDDSTKFYTDGKKVLIDDIFGEESGNKYVQYGYYSLRLKLTIPLTRGIFGHTKDCKKIAGNNTVILYFLKITFYDEDGVECGTESFSPLSISDCSVGNH